jgi:2-keto-4-pentenoate hydratase/2-oxohepta-3-ene-1,7-dioic acid hydratase in catechol pathway
VKRTPPLFLQDGDVVEVEIEGLDLDTLIPYTYQ